MDIVLLINCNCCLFFPISGFGKSGREVLYICNGTYDSYVVVSTDSNISEEVRIVEYVCKICKITVNVTLWDITSSNPP